MIQHKFLLSSSVPRTLKGVGNRAETKAQINVFCCLLSRLLKSVIVSKSFHPSISSIFFWGVNKWIEALYASLVFLLVKSMHAFMHNCMPHVHIYKEMYFTKKIVHWLVMDMVISLTEKFTKG